MAVAPVLLDTDILSAIMRKNSAALQEARAYLLSINDSSSQSRRAADIYAELHRRGELIGDADILIAASALEQNLGVATNNAAHSSGLTDSMSKPG